MEGCPVGWRVGAHHHRHGVRLRHHRAGIGRRHLARPCPRRQHLIAAGASSPLAVVTPVQWLDAMQISGVADAVVLDEWPDMSGLGQHAASGQAGGSAVRPIYYKTNSAKLVNGLPAVWFAS